MPGLARPYALTLGYIRAHGVCITRTLNGRWRQRVFDLSIVARGIWAGGRLIHDQHQHGETRICGLDAVIL